MPDASLTLAFDMPDTAPQVRETQKPAHAPVRKPVQVQKPKPVSVPSCTLDEIANYRADELAEADRNLEAAIAERDQVVKAAQGRVDVARQARIALGTEITAQRMRLRHTSYLYDYDFARQVLGDAARPPKQKNSPLPRKDPFAALMEDPNV